MIGYTFWQWLIRISVRDTGSSDYPEKCDTNTGKTLPRIEQTGKTFERVDPKSLGKLLGAEVVPTKAVRPGSPVSMFALRPYLLENLHSMNQ